MGELGHYHNVMVPFLTREMLDEGNWLLPIHYGSDMWVTYYAARYGYPIVDCPEYLVWHHLAPEGRVPHRQMEDMKFLIRSMEEAGYLPPYFETLKRKYGMVKPVVSHVD